MKLTLLPTPQKLFFSKQDPEDPRLGDIIQSLADLPNFEMEALLEQSSDVLIFGYPDDEGIKNNGGRVGAASAPQKIREFLYKMTPSVGDYHFIEATDLGDFQKDGDLGLFQEDLAKHLADFYRGNRRCLSFGGGHDYGFVDACAFVNAFGADNSLIINFDAHLDVRPVKKSPETGLDLINSGTPFYRLMTRHQPQFLEVGIQDQCNSRVHLEWLEKRGGSVLHLRHIEQVGLIKALDDYFSAFPNIYEKKVFLSFDIDSLCQSQAPGCSQSFVGGLDFAEVRVALEFIYQQFDVRGLGIYEVSPLLDFDNRTSKAAALLAHQFLYS